MIPPDGDMKSWPNVSALPERVRHESGAETDVSEVPGSFETKDDVHSEHWNKGALMLRDFTLHFQFNDSLAVHLDEVLMEG